MSVGLVLEGGGMRGLYTAGVLDVFWTLALKWTVLCQFLREPFLESIMCQDNAEERYVTIKNISLILITWDFGLG